MTILDNSKQRKIKTSVISRIIKDGVAEEYFKSVGS